MKLLYLESQEEIVDTKRATLDYFVRTNRDKPLGKFAKLKKTVEENLASMASTFVEHDELLKSAGIIPVYYVLFSQLRKDEVKKAVSRKRLLDFETLRESNRLLFAEEKDGVDFKLIEYDELAQSSNDGSAIRQRYEALRQYLKL